MSEKLLNEILGEIKNIKSDISELKSDVKGLKEDVTGLKGEVTLLKDEVTGLKGEVALLKNDVNVLKNDVSILKNEVSSIKSTLDEHTQLLKALEHRTEENTAQMNSIAENVEYLKGTQTRQEKILERLALRSIEQEAEITWLKRAK